MNNEKMFIELDQRQTEEISGGTVIFPYPAYRFAIWLAGKLMR